MTGVLEAVAGTPLDESSNIGPLHVFYRTAGGVTRLVQDQDSSWTSADLPWPGAGPLHQSQAPLGGMFVYSFASAASATDEPERKMYWCHVDYNTYQGDQISSGVVTGIPEAANENAAARLSAAGPQPDTLTILIYCGTGDVEAFQAPVDQSASNPQTGSATPMAGLPKDNPLPGGASVVLVEYLFAMDEEQLPIAVVRDDMHGIWALSANGGAAQWRQLWTPPAGQADAALSIVPGVRLIADESKDANALANKVLDVYVLCGQTLSVVHQMAGQGEIADSATPQFAPAVPLQAGLGQVTVPASRATGAGLIAIGADGSLLSLLQLPDGPWLDTQIHLPATEPLQVTSYRVQLSLTDASGRPVTGASLQVSSASPVTAMINGQAMPLEPAPVIVPPTDKTGRVTISLPAAGISAPALTVTGTGLPTPVTISPSAAVNGYLAGTTTLNYLPVLDETVLTSARTSGSPSQPLAPALQGDTTGLAATATNAIKSSATAAIPAAQPLGAQRLGAQQRLQVVTAGSAPQPRGPILVGSLSLSIDDFFHDAMHAIKTGAALVKAVTVDVENSIVSIVADFGAWAEQTLQVTIHDLDDAANAIHSLVNLIGAKIEDFLDWLKAEILSLLTDTVFVAGQYDEWLTAAFSQLAEWIGMAEADAGAWLAHQKLNIDGKLAAAQTELAGKTLADLAQQAHQPEQLSVSARRLGAAATPAGPDSHASWLLDKIQHEIATLGPPAAIPGFDTAIATLKSQVGDTLSGFESAVSKFWSDLLNGIASDPHNIEAAAVPALLEGLTAVVDALLVIAGDLVQAVLQLLRTVVQVLDSTILATPAGDLPLIGPLLPAGMSSLTMKQIVTLLIAFPTTLAYKLEHGSAAAPFKSTLSQSQHRPGRAHDPHAAALGASADLASDLKYTAAGAMGFWAFMDSISAALSIDPDGDGPPDFFTFVDIVAPCVIGILTYPASGVPFQSGIAYSTGPEFLNFLSWLCGYAPGILSAVGYESGNELAENVDALVLTSQFGAMGMAFGIMALAAADDKSPADYGIAILGNLSTVGTWGLSPEAIDSSDGLSAVAVAAVSLICGGLAAVLYGTS